MRAMAAGFLGAAALVGVSAGSASASQAQIDYRFSFFGLPIADSTMTATVNGNDYRMDVTVRSVGVVRMIEKVDGTGFSQGTMASDRLQPQSYAMAYNSDGKPWQGAVWWAGRDVERVQIEPPLKPDPTYVGLSPDHHLNVADPIANMVVRADTPQSVCDHTQRIFDGQMRMDLALSRPQTVALSVPGAPSQGVKCRAKFRPLGGYKPTKENVKYLQAADISVTYVPIGTSNLYWPVEATIPFPTGTLRMQAKSMQAG